MARTGVQLTTQQIRTFCDVLERGTYAAAARAAGLSTSAVWEQVKELEKQYATELFKRQGRQVVPTAAGETLYELLKPLLTGLDSTQQVLREEEGGRPRQITIAAGVRMLIEEIGPGLADFRRQHPNVSLRVLQSSSLQVESVVVRGEADLTMTLEPGPDHLSKAVTVEPAYGIDYLLLMPEGHELANRRNMRLADIVQHPLVLPQAGSYSRHVLDEALHRQDLRSEMKIAAETANSAFTAACVRAGLGIGIIAGRPDGVLCRGLAARSISRWLGNARIVFVWKSGTLVPPSVRELADTIRAAVTGEAR